MGALLRVAGHRRPGSRQLLAGKPLGLAKAFETKGMSVFAGRPPYGRGHHGKHRPTRAGRQSGVCHAKRAGDSTFSPSAASPITSRRGKPLPFLQPDVGQSHPNPTWQSEGPFFPPMPHAAGATEHHGSWCERWRTWLEHRCGALKPSKSARQPKASGSREGSRNIRSQLGKE